jgi:hypothetical protein
MPHASAISDPRLGRETRLTGIDRRQLDPGFAEASTTIIRNRRMRRPTLPG